MILSTPYSRKSHVRRPLFIALQCSMSVCFVILHVETENKRHVSPDSARYSPYLHFTA